MTAARKCSQSQLKLFAWIYSCGAAQLLDNSGARMVSSARTYPRVMRFKRVYARASSVAALPGRTFEIELNRVRAICGSNADFPEEM